jgi:hypothetical protein
VHSHRKASTLFETRVNCLYFPPNSVHLLKSPRLLQNSCNSLDYQKKVTTKRNSNTCVLKISQQPLPIHAEKKEGERKSIIQLYLFRVWENQWRMTSYIKHKRSGRLHQSASISSNAAFAADLASSKSSSGTFSC